MSEYQYYEFLAIDRQLTSRQIEEVRGHSSRAEITPTRFANEYSFGDFRGDPYAFLEKYFDVMVYYANWGTHRFMMRLPVDLVDADRVKRYCAGDGAARLKRAGDHLILDYTASQEEYSAWEEGGQWTSEITPVRAAVLAGDDRPLYLGWLAGVQERELEESAPEPPVPPGMGKLTGPLKAFANFLWIDEDLLAVAAEASGQARSSSDDGLANWLAHLPVAEKDRLLREFCEGTDPHLATKLRRQFRESFGQMAATSSGRTVGRLIERAEAIRGERERVEAERKSAERVRRAAEAARARKQELADLARRGDAPWQEIQALVASKQPKAYDQAVTLLKDLHELAEKAGDIARFQSRLLAICQEHARKPKFIGQLNRAGVLPKSPPTSA